MITKISGYFSIKEQKLHETPGQLTLWGRAIEKTTGIWYYYEINKKSMIDEKSKKQAITSEQLIKLIEDSKAVQGMPAEKKARLLATANNPGTPEAQKIFEALLEEQKMYENIGKNFEKIVNGAVDEYEIGIAEVKKTMKKNIRPREGATV